MSHKSNINAADRRNGEPAPPEDRKHPTFAQRVVRSHTVIKEVPDAVDFARILTDQLGPEFGMISAVSA